MKGDNLLKLAVYTFIFNMKRHNLYDFVFLYLAFDASKYCDETKERKIRMREISRTTDPSI